MNEAAKIKPLKFSGKIKKFGTSLQQDRECSYLTVSQTCF